LIMMHKICPDIRAEPVTWEKNKTMVWFSINESWRQTRDPLAAISTLRFQHTSKYSSFRWYPYSETNYWLFAVFCTYIVILSWRSV
jgi:hypothetical protein